VSVTVAVTCAPDCANSTRPEAPCATPASSVKPVGAIAAIARAPVPVSVGPVSVAGGGVFVLLSLQPNAPASANITKICFFMRVTSSWRGHLERAGGVSIARFERYPVIDERSLIAAARRLRRLL
jgi:hypothetical protein